MTWVTQESMFFPHFPNLGVGSPNTVMFLALLVAEQILQTVEFLLL